MPQIPEALVAAAGTVAQVTRLKHFETKQPDGARLLLLTGGGRGVEVKMTEQEYAVDPITDGETVALMIVQTPWEMEGGRSGMSSRYHGRITPNHIDALVSVANQSKAPVSK